MIISGIFDDNFREFQFIIYIGDLLESCMADNFQTTQVAKHICSYIIASLAEIIEYEATSIEDIEE